MKRTKIVATIGPASESEVITARLIRAGMNVARFNTKHNTPSWHRKQISMVKHIAQEIGQPVGILLDLQGPEVRVELVNDEEFFIKKGEVASFFPIDNKDTNFQELGVLIPRQVVESVALGTQVLLEDGSGDFQVVERQSDLFRARAINDYKFKRRKTLNLPGVELTMPSLIEADIAFLDEVNPEDVDFVGLSFVRNKKDIIRLKQELAQRDFKAQIVAKIENQTALDHLDEIIAVADAVMIARGDLAVEVPFVQLAHWQKVIIHKCRHAGKPVITATHMLKSMVDNPRPTRAEVTDVANAIYDGTDAVMLSEETTVGKHPVKAVETQAIIAEYNEQYAHPDLKQVTDSTNTASITHAAIDLLEHTTTQIDAVVCLTETGMTAKLLARFRPSIAIKAVTSSPRTVLGLTLVYSVEPFLVDIPEDRLEVTTDLLEKLKAHAVVKSGERVLIIHGQVWKRPGLTNALSLISIP